MRRRHALCALFTSFGVAGCGSSGPIFKPVPDHRPGRAVVYVFRPAAKGAAILSALIDVDGANVATLANGEYVSLSVPLGAHTITQRWKAGLLGNSKFENRPISLPLVVNAEDESFVRLGMRSSWDVRAGLTVHNEWGWNLELVPRSAAMPEITLCRRGQLRGDLG